LLQDVDGRSMCQLYQSLETAHLQHPASAVCVMVL